MAEGIKRKIYFSLFKKDTECTTADTNYAYNSCFTVNNRPYCQVEARGPCRRALSLYNDLDPTNGVTANAHTAFTIHRSLSLSFSLSFRRDPLHGYSTECVYTFSGRNLSNSVHRRVPLTPIRRDTVDLPESYSQSNTEKKQRPENFCTRFVSETEIHGRDVCVCMCVLCVCVCTIAVQRTRRWLVGSVVACLLRAR